MIAVLKPCMFICNPSAHAESHQQEHAKKLCLATLVVIKGAW